MRPRRGFTLLEMLVTIGVIAILVGIMFPIFAKFRQSASRVTCLARMRQLTAACLTYASDSNRQLPYCCWYGSVDSSENYGRGWLFAHVAYRTGYPAGSDLNGNWLSAPGPGHPPTDGVKTGALWPYLRDLNVYHCPIDDPTFWTGTEWMTSYLYNGAQCGYGNNATVPGYSLTRIVQPGNSVMFWEGLEQKYKGQQLTGAVWNDGSSYPSEEVLADRHFQGANIACFDGHAEWWDQSTWTYWVNCPTFGRLWCDPGNLTNGH